MPKFQIQLRENLGFIVSELVVGSGEQVSEYEILYFLGNTNIVKKLAQKNADVNAENKFDTTALMLAATQGHTDTVKVLLQNQVNINAVDYHQYTGIISRISR